MIRAFVLLIALLLALPSSVATPLAAHQQKVALSSIAHNPRTGLLEVVHRVPLHDAEHALEALHPCHGAMPFFRALVKPIRTALFSLY